MHILLLCLTQAIGVDNLYDTDVAIWLQEFMRVGYYVSTDYFEEEYRDMESPPNPPLIHKCAA